MASGYDKFSKRYRKFGIPRRLAKEMTDRQFIAMIRDIGWELDVRKGGGSHMRLTNAFLPGIVKSFARKGHLPPGDIAAYSDELGFTRIDLEQEIDKQVRILLFIERSIQVYPNKKDFLEDVGEPLYQHISAKKDLFSQYCMVKGLPCNLEIEANWEKMRDFKYVSVGADVIEPVIAEAPVPKAGQVVCTNCGQIGHLFEKCPLPYIFVLGWE